MFWRSSKPVLPVPVLQNCMSSSNVRALSGGRCGSGAKVALPVIYTASLQAPQPAAPPVEAPLAEDTAVAAAVPPFEGLVTTVEPCQQDVKGVLIFSHLSQRVIL